MSGDLFRFRAIDRRGPRSSAVRKTLHTRAVRKIFRTGAGRGSLRTGDGVGFSRGFRGAVHRIASIFAALTLGFLLCALPADARDFREPLYAYDPLNRPDSADGILADSAAELQYVNYAFRQTEYERYHVGLQATAMPLSLVGTFALSLSMGSYLTAGQVTVEPKPTVVGFLLNVVQYEYSVRGSIACGPVNCLFGYGRRSQHQLRSGLLDTGVDILSLGASIPTTRVGAVADSIPLLASGFFIARNNELYDFWESTLPDPRSRWSAELRTLFGVRVDGSVRESCEEDACWGLYVDVSGDVLLLRTGGIDVEWTARLGGRRLFGNTLTDLFLYGYRSGDTRMIPDEPTPALLIGIGGRVVVGATMW